MNPEKAEGLSPELQTALQHANAKFFFSRCD
jgi:hypothetical protein